MSRTTPARPVDVEALFPELRHHTAPATRLHPRPGDPKPSDSSVGGMLSWPSGEPWPTCTAVHRKSRGELVANIRQYRRLLSEIWSRRDSAGNPVGPSADERLELDALTKRGKYAPEIADDAPIPLLPVLQLFRSDVPDLEFPEGKDLLQVLWCPFDAHGENRAIDVRLVWRDSAKVVDPLPEPPRLTVVGNKGYLPEPCLLQPERVTEHQDVELLPVSLQEAIGAWEEEQEEADENAPGYQFDLSVAPGWKAGGFASWHLTGPAPMVCECGAPMRLLVTAASREWDNGNLSWRPVEEADDTTRGLNIPTRVVLGRDGSLRVFVCTVDAEHPYQVNEQ
ncbi:hypothetical protein ACFQ6N_31575 [Kitasatospora sp. NPDC056446]|uniref:hypothetical protein n=1 Tax=Kitasatospora sp. NPDC056446 TaxID=3345819 RepID=UPI0036C7A661